MLGFRELAGTAAFLLPTAVAQFVPAPTDLISKIGYAGYNVRYKEVPSGICETTEGVKSYSGYVDVSEHQHIFFWFFEARNVDPSTAPLTIWLNGGPGDPSMVGAFSENGPCTVDYDGNLQYNKYSWSNASNMIYIDQPTQVGFSYSDPVPGYIDADTGDIIPLPSNVCPDDAPVDTCGTYSFPDASNTADSTPTAAPNVWRTLQGFMGVFPQYARNGVYLGTESYGGHFGPVFSEYFETQNANLPKNASDICLHGLIINNGWYDPRIQYPAYYTYIVNNTYDFHPFNNSQLTEMHDAFYGEGNCVDQLTACNNGGTDDVCSTADDFCYGVESLYDDITGRDEYDIRELSPDPYPYTNFVAYLNTPRVQQAIGAYQNFSYAVTNLGGGVVSNAFGTTGDDAKELGIIADIQELIKKGVYVLAYHGDADYNCNWLGGEEVANEIKPPGWAASGYQNISTSDNIVHGVVRQSGIYSFARIYQSGHQVPFYQPLTSLTLFQRLLARTDMATGKTAVKGPSYKSSGPKTSTFHNGNSTIQYTVTDPSQTYNTISNKPNPLKKTKRFSKLLRSMA